MTNLATAHRARWLGQAADREARSSESDHHRINC
jgi:hypothetical protein